MLPNSCEIIIIRYNNLEDEKVCIESVVENTKGIYHLTVYDNYPHNENLANLWNKLIKRSDAEYICLLNSDTKVKEGWLEKLIEVFKKEENPGVVGPSTNEAGNPQVVKWLFTSYQAINYRKFYPLGYLAGFCMVFPKKVWEEVRGFPKNAPFYSQEGVFQDRVCNKGYNLYWRKDVFVWHKGASSAIKAKMNLEEEHRIGRKYLAKTRGECK